MKQLLLSILFTLSITVATAQVQDKTETDCNAANQSVYEVLSQGKVLFIAADAFDCSICKSHASSINTFANDNTAGVQVWGAMNFKYSSATPACSDIDGWKSSYGWDNVFMFLDDAGFWQNQGYPHYTVIDPADKTIAYEGFSHTTAMAKAKEIADQNTSSVTTVSQDIFKVHVNNGKLISTVSPNVYNATIELIDMTGKVVAKYTQQNANDEGRIEVALPDALKKGVYFAVLRTREKVMTTKFYFGN